MRGGRVLERRMCSSLSDLIAKSTELHGAVTS
jgi:hypothetical protein